MLLHDLLRQEPNQVDGTPMESCLSHIGIKWKIHHDFLTFTVESFASRPNRTWLTTSRRTSYASCHFG
eukprot:3663836-Amphidinium_carterae.1